MDCQSGADGDDAGNGTGEDLVIKLLLLLFQCQQVIEGFRCMLWLAHIEGARVNAEAG